MRTANVALSVLSFAKSAIKQDMANRYVIIKDWVLPLVNLALKPFENDFLKVEPLSEIPAKTRITVKANSDAVIDGVTLFPDNLDKGLLHAALFHDVWYNERRDIAKKWEMPVTYVRRIGDAIFSSISGHEGTPNFLRRLTYNAVFWFGGVYGKVARLLGMVVVLLAVGGCSGCLSPPDLFDPDDGYTPPEFEKVAQTIIQHGKVM